MCRLVDLRETDLSIRLRGTQFIAGKNLSQRRLRFDYYGRFSVTLEVTPEWGNVAKSVGLLDFVTGGFGLRSPRFKQRRINRPSEGSFLIVGALFTYETPRLAG